MVTCNDLLFAVCSAQHIMVKISNYPYDSYFGSPIFTHLAGSSSVWKALSPTVLQAAFNVDSGVEQLFRSKRTADAIFFPPPK